jgi:hypothetical protein
MTARGPLDGGVEGMADDAVDGRCVRELLAEFAAGFGAELGPQAVRANRTTTISLVPMTN